MLCSDQITKLFLVQGIITISVEFSEQLEELFFDVAKKLDRCRVVGGAWSAEMRVVDMGRAVDSRRGWH